MCIREQPVEVAEEGGRAGKERKGKDSLVDRFARMAAYCNGGEKYVNVLGSFQNTSRDSAKAHKSVGGVTCFRVPRAHVPVLIRPQRIRV